ncbi:MAG: VOC family protein [Gammaproteobacteria bacterium]|nr:VOC family protein [Gammaproteobacteria bacterium]
MDNTIPGKLDLGACDQVGFVFADLEAAIAQYDPLFGPFEVQEYGAFEYNYRGSKDQCELRIAFGKSGELEIELIQWVSGGSPHKEFLDAGREGMHHLRFRVDSLDQKVSEARQFGYQSIWETRFGEGLAVAYLEREGDPLLIELFENLHG